MKNNNNFKRVLIATILFVAVYLGVKTLNKPQTIVGEKAIQIVVVDKDDETVIDKVFNTDGELLGDLIDEINELEETFVLSGNKDDEYGRFILEILNAEKDDNDFWVYDSENNTVCASEGFCPGVDLLAIANEDIFTFTVLKP